MSIYYVDAVGGNDANNGTSFALRKKTATSLGATPVGDDEIRVMGNGAPTLVGNATFTNQSPTLTLASAVTLNIETCETAWSAAANVTATATSTSGQYKEGSAAANLVIAAAFTTGRVAHKQIGGGVAVDFSAYRQISFWFFSTGSTASGVYEIRLCSDTGGTVAVNTITVNFTGTATGNVWKCVTLDTGGALSNNVQSVALYAVSDPGAVTVRLDNILACKAPTSADSLTLNSLIGKSGEAPYMIQSINGTTVILGGSILLTSGSTNLRGYYGSTATVAAYKVQAQQIATNSSQTVSSFATMGCSGTAGHPILISGGWNTTDMSTQDSETWIQQASNANIGISAAGKSFLTFSKLHFVQFYNGYNFTSCNNITITSPQCFGNFAYGIFMDALCGNCTITSPQCFLNGNYGLTPGSNTTVTDPILYGNASMGLAFYGGGNNTVTNAIIANNFQAIDFYVYSNNRIYNSTISASYGGTGSLTVNTGTGYMFNCTVTDATEFVATSTFTAGKIFSHNHDGTTDNHMIFTDGGLIQSDAVTREKTSGIAWRFDVTSANRSATYPLTAGSISRPDMIKFACKANKLVTISARVMRSNTGITFQLVCPGGQIAGVAADVVASAAALATVYETITITFTPTAAGVVDIYMRAYGGTTFSAYLDRFTTIQQDA